MAANEAIDKLFEIYNLLEPTDLKSTLRTKYKNYSLSDNVLQNVIDVYVNSMVSGDEIVSRLNNQDKDIEKFAYSTIYQPKGKDSQVRIVSPGYWKYRKENSDVKITSVQLDLLENKGDLPADVTINVLRTPLLSLSKRNINEITTFLNYIPSHFASQMVPYFDVEFQLPIPTSDKKTNYTNRMSLLRFLEGTRDLNGIKLTDADRALNQVNTTPTKTGPKDVSAFIGMELFTTPQTLVNMNTLSAGNNGYTRLNDAQPFLPPASITGATISIMNAGAGAFAHKKATLTLKVHDKARLAEFADLFRGPAGYRDIKVWLTYGWLAPRGRGEDDVYAKFINYNMLVKEAFTIYNSSFNFEATGEISVSLEMVTAGMSTLDTTTIGGAVGVRTAQREVQLAIEAIGEANRILNQDDDGPFKEIRIFQVLSSAAAGSLEPDVKGNELKTLIANARKTLAKIPLESSSDREKVEKGLRELERLYVSEKKTKSLVENIEAEAINFVANTFNKIRTGKDPFIPRTAAPTNSKIPDPKAALFNPELTKALATYNEPSRQNIKNVEPIFTPQKTVNIVSFGKLFCSFCMPAILEAASLDNIDEVQVNFYMLNENCGPISLCNIAEFPIDIRVFEQQFASRVEARGGDDLTIEEFVQFVAEVQFGDERAPGYDMFKSYEPFDGKEQEAKRAGDETKQSNAITEWMKKYGVFKKPSLAIKIETLESGKPVGGKSDLLFSLGQSAAELYKTKKKPTDPGKKIIKRIHIYDKTLNPYYAESRILKFGEGPGARFVAVAPKDEEVARNAIAQVGNNIAAAKAANPKALGTRGEKVTVNATESGNNVTLRVDGKLTPPKQSNGKDVSVESQSTTLTLTEFPGGKRILADIIGKTLPTIVYGAQGTLVTSAQVASKVDGLQGTINMQGGVASKRSAPTEDGLAMDTGKLPLQVLPAQLSITSMGCPIAELYQQFFFDFNTGTTLDNLYNCTALTHSFSPGKFETSWTFLYTDGYGKLHGSPSLKNFAESLQKAAEK